MYNGKWRIIEHILTARLKVHVRAYTSAGIWVTDFAQGMFRLAIPHCAVCTFNKVNSPLVFVPSSESILRTVQNASFQLNDACSSHPRTLYEINVTCTRRVTSEKHATALMKQEEEKTIGTKQNCPRPMQQLSG